MATPQAIYSNIHTPCQDHSRLPVQSSYLPSRVKKTTLWNRAASFNFASSSKFTYEKFLYCIFFISITFKWFLFLVIHHQKWNFTYVFRLALDISNELIYWNNSILTVKDSTGYIFYQIILTSSFYHIFSENEILFKNEV